MAQVKPIIHGRDHLPGGADPPCPNGIDSTDNVGINCGVRSFGPETEGYVLTADGDGGSVWSPAASGVLNPSYGMYDTATDTVPGNSTGYAATWSHVNGAALLNLSTATLPTIITDGVYAITGTASFGGGWSAGTFPFGELVIHGTPSTDFWFQSQTHGSGFSNFPPNASFHVTFQATAGQPISLEWSNFDGATSHAFSAGQIRVQLIGTT